MAFDRVIYVDPSTGAQRLKYPGVVNFATERTFCILEEGTSAADINAALTDYDVVYLESGSYTCGSTSILVLGGKSLIGLGGGATGSTTILNFSSGVVGRHVRMYAGSTLENINIVIDTASTVQVIEGAGSVIVKKVYVSAASATTVYAFSGSFTVLDQIHTSNVEGVYISSTYTWYGGTLISNFYIDSAPTYGIRIYNTGGVTIRDGWIAGNAGTTDYGIYIGDPTAAKKDILVQDVVVAAPGISGFYVLGTSSYDITAHFRGCYVYGATSTTDIGFYATYADRSTWTSCYAEYCNGTTGNTYGGFIVLNSDFIYLDGCASRSASGSSNSGFYASAVNYSTLCSLNSYGDYNGVYLASGIANAVSNVSITLTTGIGFYSADDNNVVSNVTVYDPGTYGFYFIDSDDLALSNLRSYSHGSGGYGIYLGSCDRVALSSASVYAGANHGIYVDTCTSCTFTSIVSNGNTGASSNGVYLNGCSYSTLTGVCASANGNRGIEANITQCVLSDITVTANTSHGLIVTNGQYSEISDVAARSNGGSGVITSTNNYLSIRDLRSDGNTGYGLSHATNPTTAWSSSVNDCHCVGNTAGAYQAPGGSTWNGSGNY